MDIDFSSKQKALLYLDRTYFLYYDAKSQRILRVNIPPTSIRELDVINEDEIDALLKLFIESNALSPASVTIVLAEPVLFYKPFSHSQPVSEEAVKDFIDAVPFDDVGYRAFTVSDGHMIVATNKEFYQVFKEILEEKGFDVKTVFPSLLLDQYIPGIVSGLDEHSAKRILASQEKIRSFNFLDSIYVDSTSETGRMGKRLFSNLQILLGVFGLLIIILIILLVRQAPPPKPQATPELLKKTIEESTPPTTQRLNNLSVRILTPSQGSTLSATLISKLNEAGITQVTSGIQTELLQNSSIQLNTTVSQQDKDRLIPLLKLVLPDATIQDVQDASFSATVSIQ